MGKNRDSFPLKLARYRALAGRLFIVLAAILGQATPYSLLAGLFFVCLGEGLRTAAAGIIKKNETVACTGPYSWCRHPLYLGSFFITLGIILAAGNLFLVIFGALLFLLFYVSAILVEEKGLCQKFGEAYLRYQQTTPCFLPIIRVSSWQDFHWTNVWHNREHINWILLSLLFLWLGVKRWILPGF
ncbi:MAG: isoprenylcysteine carboxylmethyltransferase family protein [Candidatus Omnitrophica bacterium]|nr:isoprenylcysteine carboxylmethyltransferase family protein [Candidatus Omnitrophota bacterium]MCM8769930.1 isoprenylcysteine carboxylmethyltransferase family protein [Candidatus Omnitrophota bacterium]